MEEAFKLQAKMVGKGFKPKSEIYDAFILGYSERGNMEMSDTIKSEMSNTQLGRNDGKNSFFLFIFIFFSSLPPFFQ